MQIAYSGGQAFHMQQPTPIQSVGADIRGYGREPVNAAPVNANANQVRPLYRLQVMGIPHYLSLDEFRNQFMKLEGCANACLEKSEMGYATWRINRCRQHLPLTAAELNTRVYVQGNPRSLCRLCVTGIRREMRVHFLELERYVCVVHLAHRWVCINEACTDDIGSHAGWGPKGLAFQRMGHLAAELKRPPGVRLFSSG